MVVDTNKQLTVRVTGSTDSKLGGTFFGLYETMCVCVRFYVFVL